MGLEGDLSLPPKCAAAPSHCHHGLFADAWQTFREQLLFLLSATQKGKWDMRGRWERPVGGSQASYLLQGVGLCTEGRRRLCLGLSPCKASPPRAAFDDECPSQTGWRTGLSVLDLAHPTHLKHGEWFFSCHPRAGDSRCLSVCCLQQASDVSSHSTGATAVSQKSLRGREKGLRRDGEKGK